jgi:hypothetical protein
MFVLTQNVSASQKAIATLLATAVVLWTLGYHATAQAANITGVSDTLTDSAPSADSVHTIRFTIPTGGSLDSGEDIVIDFGFESTDWDTSALVAGDVTVTAPDANFDAAVIDSVNDTVTISRNTSSVTAGTEIVIEVGSTTGTMIANPAAPTAGNQSYEIAISAGTEDSGYARVVVLDTVLVTARVATTFDFTVIGKASATINGEATNTATASTTIAFGTLAHDTEYTAAQELNVVTNAANGFIVTLQSDGEFRSSTGAEIDGFVNNSDVAAPTSWSAPGATPGSPDIAEDTEWGHWAITTDDSDAGDGLFDGTEVGANEWFAATTTARTVFAHTGSADGTTADIGSTTIGFRVEISPLQEAGDDYQTILTYIATPTF